MKNYQLLKVTHRVGDGAVYTNLEMQVRTEAVTGAAAVPDDVALRNRLAGRDRERALVGVAGGEPAAVVDAGVVAVAAAAGLGLGEDHGAVGGGADRGAFRDGDVDPGMELVAGADVAATEGRDHRPVARPDQAAAAPLGRPRRQRRRAGGGELGGDLALDRGDVAVDLFLVFADPRQRQDPLAPGGHQRLLVALQRGTGGGQRLLFGGDRVARRFDLVLGRAQAVDDPPHLVAQFAHAPDHGLVHAVQAVEVFGPGGEVVDAAGADDDAEYVRAAGLVHRHQAVAQGAESPFEAGAQFLEVPLGDVEIGDRAVELGLLGGEPGAHGFLAAADRRPLPGEGGDLVGAAGDRRRQHALLVAHLVELGLLGFEFGLQALGRRGAGKEQKGEGHHDGSVPSHRSKASQAPNSP